METASKEVLKTSSMACFNLSCRMGLKMVTYLRSFGEG